MLKEVLQGIVVVLLVVALAMLGSATKLASARKIILSGAVKGETNFDGSNDVSIVTTQDNIVVVTGTIIMPEANESSIQGSVDVNYPLGFNKDNCAVLSVMSHNTSHTDWWSTPKYSGMPSSSIAGNGDTCVMLKPNNITIQSHKVNTSEPRKDVTFKVVLIKV